MAKDLPSGHVTGIDFSDGMLSEAIRKKDERAIHNVTFIEMDMQAIDFPNNHFDIAVSAFSIFFVEDMEKQLIHIAEKVKSGGRIIITTFSDNTFSPLLILFLERLGKYGLEVPTLAWKRVATIEQCTSLFKGAGLHDISSNQVQSGYYLSSASDWWYIIWNGGFRGLVNQLSPNEFTKFKEEHLAEVKNLATDQGIWLELNVLYTIGTKRA